MKLNAAEAFALQQLQLQEIDFLLAFGWINIGKDIWKPPPNYLRKKVSHGYEQTYNKGHAVNSQKWTNANVRT